jgi:hypothetical protein
LWREFDDEAEIVERLLSHGSSGRDDRAGQRAEQGRLRQADADTDVDVPPAPTRASTLAGTA